MKLKSNIAIAAGITLLTLAACNKEKMAATAPAADKTNTKAVSAKMEAYDYSQPLDKIISDAIAGSSERVRGVFKDDTYGVDLRPGWYLGPDPQTGATMCLWAGFVCEVIVTPDPEPSDVHYGSNDRPIGVITALENWPLARLATEVSYEEDEDGYRIKHTFID